MYQFKDIVLNVKEISVIDSKIAYIRNNQFFIGKEILEINPMLYQEDVRGNVWIKDSNWGNFLIIFKEKKIKKLDFNIGLNGKVEKVIMIAKNGQLSICSTISQENICDINIKGTVRYYFERNNYLFCHIDNYKIISLSLLTGNYEWEVDLANLQLSESVTLKSTIGVWHNELLLWLNDALLVSLDVMNGELLWSYDLDESVKGFGAVLMSPFYHEKEDSDTIHCFGASGYLTFDLVSRKATFHKSFGRVGTGMSPHLSTKSGDYFYFVGRDYSIKDGLGVGIFNCKTFNIDWFYTSPEWKDDSNNFIAFSSAPQVTDNELYVLENGSGTLHIFEKEKM